MNLSIFEKEKIAYIFYALLVEEIEIDLESRRDLNEFEPETQVQTRIYLNLLDPDPHSDYDSGSRY